MNLQDIRRMVVELSGRFDLVDPTYDDAYLPTVEANPVSVDYFITAGLRLLDDLVDTPDTEHVYSVGLVAGSTSIAIPMLKSIAEVWVEDTTETAGDQVQIILKDAPITAIQTYGIPPFTSVDRDKPQYYITYPLRARGAEYTNVGNIGRHIYLLPPADGVYTLKVRGLFFSAPLVNQTDVNWWTLEYPHTVVQSALYCIERFYRNSEGMNDHMTAIERDVLGIDKNMAADSLAEVNSMRNSW